MIRSRRRRVFRLPPLLRRFSLSFFFFFTSLHPSSLSPFPPTLVYSLPPLLPSSPFSLPLFFFSPQPCRPPKLPAPPRSSQPPLPLPTLLPLPPTLKVLPKTTSSTTRKASPFAPSSVRRKLVSFNSLRPPPLLYKMQAVICKTQERKMVLRVLGDSCSTQQCFRGINLVRLYSRTHLGARARVLFEREKYTRLHKHVNWRVLPREEHTRR